VTPSDLHRMYLCAIGAVVLFGGAALSYESVKHKGAVEQLTKQAAATLREKQQEARDSLVAFQNARQAASDSARQAMALVGAARRETVRRDSVAKEASDERERATRLMSDTTARLADLQLELGALVSRTRADSVASARQHAADSLAIAALLHTHVADSTAIERGIGAVNASTRRAVTAEAEVTALRRLQPSAFGNVVRGAVLVAAGVGIGRSIH
jgi:hypothetical protein